MALTVDTREIVCCNCAQWFQVTLWLKNRGALTCPACGCNPYSSGQVAPDQKWHVRCDDKDLEIARLGRVIAGLRGALSSKRRLSKKGSPR